MIEVFNPEGTKELSDVVRILESNSRLVESVPHSGRYYGPEISNNLNLDIPAVDRTARIGMDHSVFNLIDPNELDRMTIVWTNLARAVLDVNRGREDYDHHSVIGGPTIHKSQGVIWNSTIEKEVRYIQRMLSEPYSHEQYERLMKLGLDPFEFGIISSMTKASNRYGVAVLWDKHSVWAPKTSNVESGEHEGAYLIGDPSEIDPLNQGKQPDLYLMHSGDISCPPEFRKFVREHFEDYNLVIIERNVASPRFNLAHRKYANRGENWFVSSTEYRGHKGLERNRENGEIIYAPDPIHERKLIVAITDLEIKLSNGDFPHEQKLLV